MSKVNNGGECSAVELGRTHKWCAAHRISGAWPGVVTAATIVIGKRCTTKTAWTFESCTRVGQRVVLGNALASQVPGSSGGAARTDLLPFPSAPFTSSPPRPPGCQEFPIAHDQSSSEKFLSQRTALSKRPDIFASKVCSPPVSYRRPPPPPSHGHAGNAWCLYPTLIADV